MLWKPQFQQFVLRLIERIILHPICVQPVSRLLEKQVVQKE